MIGRSQSLGGSHCGRLRASLAGFVAAVVGVCCPGQLPEGGWAITTSSQYLQYHDSGFAPVDLAAVSAGSHWDGLAVDDRGVVYNLEGYTGLVRVLYDALASSYRLIPEWPGALYPGTNGSGSSFPSNHGGGHIAVTREWVWVADQDGRLFRVERAVNNRVFTLVGNVQVATGAPGVIVSVCSDGRELFCAVLTPAMVSEIWAVDLRRQPLAVRRVATIPSNSAYQTSLALGADGNLLAMGLDALYSVNVRSGQAAMVDSCPPSSLFATLSGWPAQEFQIRVAYDPWSDVVAIAPSWLATLFVVYSRHLQGTAPFSSAYGSAFLGGLRKIVCASEQPFELYGVGCLTGLGAEPRMGWRGVPRQGQAFSLTLRDAEPNGLAAFWLGTSDSFWPGVGSMPWDAASLGAPGCAAYASGDFSLFTLVDTSGNASVNLAVPVNAALHGFRVFAQSVSTSGANYLGFATSDAVAVRLR